MAQLQGTRKIAISQNGQFTIIYLFAWQDLFEINYKQILPSQNSSMTGLCTSFSYLFMDHSSSVENGPAQVVKNRLRASVLAFLLS